MKKFLLVCLAAAALFLAGNYIYYQTEWYLPLRQGEPEVFVKTEGKGIFLRSEDTWSSIDIRGVNVGSGMPSGFATEYKITYEMYMRWFQLIQEMEANVIRVYTIQGENFYHALYDYNKDNPRPLYLIQGVWVDDYAMRSHLDAYSDEMRGELQKDVRVVSDVIHGRKKIPYTEKYAYGTFKWDVSPYVLGYIIGVEWESDLVLYTDDKKAEITGYDGEYICTSEEATPFECMLAEVGDELLRYETGKYREQRLVAFSNWPETDPLEHATWKINQSSNLAHLDVEHIIFKENVLSGTFASYHVYPYYPLFYEFEERYSQYIDEEGRSNPYRRYLMDLNEHHSVPVVIAEFGIPSSRGIARYDEARGFDQGNTDEKQQGEELQELYKDIREAGCVGGIVFEWQDEWFKRTWNTWPGVDLTRNVFWSDFQTNEQSFGLLTFDPGEEESICYVDDSIADWEQVEPLLSADGCSLSLQYDEKFLYFRIHDDAGVDGKKYYIPLDITPNSGALCEEETGLSFQYPVDFLITIDGEENSAVTVQEYYDMVYANFRRDIWNNEDAFLNQPQKDSTVFHTIYQYLRGPIEISEGVKTKPQIFDTGKLNPGNANPESEDFYSIADFYIQEKDIEIRLPWLLLNFSDPSEMKIHDDYYVYYGVENLKIDEIHVGLQTAGRKELHDAGMEAFALKGWDEDPTWHERLKKSYAYIQEIYREYSEEG